MSTNQVTPYNANRPSLAGDMLREQPTRLSAEGRAIARTDRRTVVKAHQLANEAAVQDFANELSHQLKLNEIQRRGRRALEVMHGQAALMSVAQTLAHGDPAMQMEYLDVYNAWKQGEIYRLATE
jgi:hypothetical protein